ncbi:MerR family transcriptional regulator [Sediminispirochaeta smaragdinae]|uniref:Transcriptional regulator, MerR family n=1 Tax=Sediminispirochaeta smaragdinae (strain DSM 11293 / JCM 15392 / SEBR 4228) TaxID=573413 RepID=E1R7U1_SEDSS|nr:MerR family transcriptional regulator [Sediminispirochaeta smaragdinae]ADK82796.1 transcriptional regulator, MerR family [Sediminispirochaeta smaragdinae DSM 11293]
MERLSIGKMAFLNGVTVQTLRLYDRLGLLKPEEVDAISGYRYYDLKQSARLDAIQHLKTLGMPLKAIKEQFDRKDMGRYKDLLRAQARLIEKRREELNLMSRAVERALENCRRYEEAPTEGLIVLEHLPERLIFRYNGGIDIYECGLEGYETLLRRLKARVALRGLPMAYFCNVGSIVRKSDLEIGRMRSADIFLFVDNEFAERYQSRESTADDSEERAEGIESIAEGVFACVYFRGFEKELGFAERLLNHIAANRMRINGDYLCEVVAELPLFPTASRDMLVKLEIPVMF